MFPKAEDPMLTLLDSMYGSKHPIEDQEKRGQDSMVSSEVLPKKINSGTREQFEKMGIVFGADADDLFVFVTLPDGWKKQATEHSMWSNLVDERGRIRATIFYKAAFYDRDAFLNISRRFSVSSFEGTDENGKPVRYDMATHFSTFVLDSGKPSILIGVRDNSYNNPVADKHEEMARAWLNNNYPNHNDPLAYWN